MKSLRIIIITSAIPLLFLLHLSAKQPYRIGTTGSFTGKYSNMSRQIINGYRLWMGSVNERGGISGRPVELVIYDDKSDSKTIVKLYRKLILEDRVDFIFGPYSSSLNSAILQVADMFRYPLLTTGGSSDKLWQQGYKHVFGVFTPASKYSVGFLEMLVLNKIRKIGIVYPDNIFSRSIAAGTKKWAERYNLKTAVYKMVPTELTGYLEIIKSMRSSGVEAVIMCGHFNESVLFRKALKRSGWKPKAYFASVGPSLDGYKDAVGPDANLTFSSSQWESSGVKYPGSSKYTIKYMNQYGSKPSYHAASAYATGQVLEYAIKKAASLDREKIGDKIAETDMVTIIGRFGVDKKGVQVRHFNLTIQWQKGRKEIVWPKEFQTARPVLR